MTVYIQHSYGKSDKITQSIDKDLTAGIIFSPKGESSPEKMIETIDEYAKMNVSTLLDPQFHLGLIENCPDSKIKEYAFFHPNLQPKDFMSPKKVLGYVNSCLDFQKNLNLSGLISPSCIIESFEDRWCMASMNMAQSSIDYAKECGISDIYITFVISDTAFIGSKESLDDFITTLTSIEGLDKIYLVINKTLDAYSPQIESVKLQNIMYFIYSLSRWNNIKIICGYSDLLGVMYLTAGAEIITTGWSQKSRFFCRGNYREMSGGSTPRPKYTSLPLLNIINITPELDMIKKFGLLDEILSVTEYDNIILQTPVPDSWARTSFYHHLNCLKIISEELLQIDVDNRPDIMETKINRAIELYDKLISKHVPFAQHTGKTHLNQWKVALTNFRGMLN